MGSQGQEKCYTNTLMFSSQALGGLGFLQIPSSDGCAAAAIMFVHVVLLESGVESSFNIGASCKEYSGGRSGP